MSMMVEIGLHSLLLMLVDVGLPSLMVMMVEKGLQSLVTKLGDKGLPLHLAYLRFGGRGQEDNEDWRKDWPGSGWRFG